MSKIIKINPHGEISEIPAKEWDAEVPFDVHPELLDVHPRIRPLDSHPELLPDAHPELRDVHPRIRPLDSHPELLPDAHPELRDVHPRIMPLDSHPELFVEPLDSHPRLDDSHPLITKSLIVRTKGCESNAVEIRVAEDGSIMLRAAK